MASSAATSTRSSLAWQFLGIGFTLDFMHLLGFSDELDRSKAEQWGRLYQEMLRAPRNDLGVGPGVRAVSELRSGAAGGIEDEWISATAQKKQRSARKCASSSRTELPQELNRRGTGGAMFGGGSGRFTNPDYWKALAAG